MLQNMDLTYHQFEITSIKKLDPSEGLRVLALQAAGRTHSDIEAKMQEMGRVCESCGESVSNILSDNHFSDL